MKRNKQVNALHHPRTKTGFLALSAISLACAPSLPPVEYGLPTGYERLQDHALHADGFERAPTGLDPAEIVPRDLLQGPFHVIRSTRLNKNFLYTFVVDTNYGEIEVTGHGLLRKRVLELEALGELEEQRIGSTRRFAYELANAAADPIEETLQILRHPVRTTTNMPRGALASVKALREMKERGRTELEDSYFEEFIGLSAHKRAWAERMGVDPYSTNPHVQSRLWRNGLLSLASDLSVTLATIPVPARGASIALSVVGATSGINQQLADVAPEDVRVTTRSWLRDEVGVEGELADRFLKHPWYSPSRQATIIRSLSRMRGAAHLDRFIDLATRADEPHEAYAFTRLALMFAECHARRSPIEELFVSQGFLMAQTAEGDVVLPLYLDHAYWTAEVAEAAAEIVGALRRERSFRRQLLIVSGSLSPRVTAELTRRNWEVVEGLEQLWLTERDLAMYQPKLKHRRILPEIGR